MVRVQVKRLQRGLFCRIGAISRVAFSNCIVQSCEASRRAAFCAQPHSLWYFQPGATGSPSPRSSAKLSTLRAGDERRSPTHGSPEALITAAGARARKPSACFLGQRLEVDVFGERVTPRAGRARHAAPSPSWTSGGFGDWLRCSDSWSPHAPARSVPPWRGLVRTRGSRIRGRARRAERGVGVVEAAGRLPIRRLGPPSASALPEGRAMVDGRRGRAGAASPRPN